MLARRCARAGPPTPATAPSRGGLVRRHGARHAERVQAAPRPPAPLVARRPRASPPTGSRRATLLWPATPSGPADALPGARARVCAFARRQRPAVGVVGASEDFALARRRRAAPLYLGDEAIVRRRDGSRSRAARRKSLRKAVNRVAPHGYRAEVHVVGDLDAGGARGARGRQRALARGRAGARLLDGARRAGRRAAARRARRARPRRGRRRRAASCTSCRCSGAPACRWASCAATATRPTASPTSSSCAPSSLLGERGIEEFSLNFAAFGRWLRAPANAAGARCSRVVCASATAVFQIERLHRFNAKFDPALAAALPPVRAARSLPRVALAAMWAEGQLPKPRLAWRRACLEPRLRNRGAPA